MAFVVSGVRALFVPRSGCSPRDVSGRPSVRAPTQPRRARPPCRTMALSSADSATGAIPDALAKHLGTWAGTSVTTDARTGAVLDRHTTRIEVGVRGGKYAQRNTYAWDDGRTKVLVFGGALRDGGLTVETPRLKGRAAFPGDDGLVLFYAQRKDADESFYDVIRLLSPTTRARTWQVCRDGALAHVISVSETRVSFEDAYFDVE